MRYRRIFLIVLDSLGIGGAPDAAAWGDAGSDTLAALVKKGLKVPHLRQLGLFNIAGVNGDAVKYPTGVYGRLREASVGKDTTTGHWELAGLISDRPFPTYPNGFPVELMAELSRRCGHGILCNRPYSGTQVIADYGDRQRASGDLIVYTSADSVLQIAAHIETTGLEELYRCCRIARELMTGEHAVSRVIARPFAGEAPYTRTADRKDFSVEPPQDTVLDILSRAGRAVLAVGKIGDIFANRGITRSYPVHGNADCMEKLFALMQEDFTGLCFVNLVDFDMLYGHRNDTDGYCRALETFDEQLGRLMPLCRSDDLLLIAGDHGCDPSTESTDHSREDVPLLAFSTALFPANAALCGMADVGATVAKLLEVPPTPCGTPIKALLS